MSIQTLKSEIKSTGKTYKLSALQEIRLEVEGEIYSYELKDITLNTYKL